MVKEKDMEVRINGNDGPSVKFRIGLMAIVQVIAALITFGVALKVLSADVDRLKIQNDNLQKEILIIREVQAKILALLEDLREEQRYQRDRIDKRWGKE